MLDKYMKGNMNFTRHSDKIGRHMTFFEKIMFSNFSVKNK